MATWPWSRWSRWQRSTAVAQILTKVVVGTASIASAVVLLLGLGPQAYHAVFWREVEYDRLSAFHAGFSIDSLKQELGQPSIVAAIAQTSYVETVFLRREHIVLAISDRPGNVLVYSVLSCSPDFRPTFSTEAGTDVQLQTRPLASVEVPSTPLSSAENDARLVSYGPASTASSPNMLVEQDPGGMSNARRGRGYFVGVNGVCADLSPAGDAAYLGPIEEAPADLAASRTTIATNFYAESNGVFGTLGEIGTFSIDATSTNPATEVFLSPLQFNLPFELTDESGTRTFG